MLTNEKIKAIYDEELKIKHEALRQAVADYSKFMIELEYGKGEGEDYETIKKKAADAAEVQHYLNALLRAFWKQTCRDLFEASTGNLAETYWSFDGMQFTYEKFCMLYNIAKDKYNLFDEFDPELKIHQITNEYSKYIREKNAEKMRLEALVEEMFDKCSNAIVFYEIYINGRTQEEGKKEAIKCLDMILAENGINAYPKAL